MNKVNEIRKKKVAAEIELWDARFDPVTARDESLEGFGKYRGRAYPVFLDNTKEDTYAEQAAEQIIPMLDKLADSTMAKAKAVETGEWVEGYYVKASYMKDGEWKYSHRIYTGHIETSCFSAVTFSSPVDNYEIDPETLCLSTGIKDKNDIMIWENDICNYFNPEDKDGIAVIEPNYARWVGGTISTTEMVTHLLYLQCSSEWEVVGNIFDNPELMECSEEEPEENKEADTSDVSSKATYHTLRSAFKRWLTLHDEEYRMHVHTRVPSWFGYAIRNSKDYAYTVTNEMDEIYCNRCELDYNSRRRYEGHYSFYISDKELFEIQRPEKNF